MLTNHRNQKYADLLTDDSRRRIRLFATLSTIFGCVAEVMLDSNTVIILYLLALGGSNSFSMFSTSLYGIASVLLFIPSAGIVNRFGIKLTYTVACLIGTAAYLLMAAAPWFGKDMAPAIVISGTFLYCLSRPPYVATWYPMCDSFLRANERGPFFGSMRFTYMSFNAVLIFLIGCFMGKETPIWLFQIIIAFAGLCILGRISCLNQLPKDPRLKKERLNIPTSMNLSLHNLPLLGYCLYIVLLHSAVMGAFALAIIFMKQNLELSPFNIMLITSIGQAGQIAGYGIFGKCSRRWSVNQLQVFTHLLFFVCIATLTMLFKENPMVTFWLALLFFGNGVASSFLMCLSSMQMLILPGQGNKVMAMAFVSTSQNLGSAISRVSMTMILAFGILAPSWHCRTVYFTSFHSMFMGAAFLTLLGMLFLLLICQQKNINEN